MPPKLTTSAGDPKRITAKQGQYLAFIYYYGKIHGMAPAEGDFRQYFRVSPHRVGRLR